MMYQEILGISRKLSIFPFSQEIKNGQFRETLVNTYHNRSKHVGTDVVHDIDMK